MLKTLLASISDVCARQFAILSTRRRGVSIAGRCSHVILAPSSRGNLGDEAMLASCIASIRERTGSSPIVLLTHAVTDDWSDLGDVRQICIGRIFSAIGWIGAIRATKEVLAGARTFSVLGADIMDGRYSRSRSFRRLMLLEMAGRLGVESAILGFSYSDRPNASVQRYFQKLSSRFTCNARDRVSFERLTAFSCGHVKAVADTAFLLPKAQSLGRVADDAVAFARRSRASGRVVIAFNANPLGSAMSAGASRGSARVCGLEDIVVRNLQAIGERCQSADFIFIAHDRRQPHSDSALLTSVFGRLEEGLRQRVHLALEDVSAAEIKRICSECDMAVTGRMHMGIAALGSCVPTMLLDFQGKVRGLVELVDGGNLSYGWEEFVDAAGFANRVHDLLTRRNEIRERLDASAAEVRRLARLNFEMFGDLKANARYA